MKIKLLLLALLIFGAFFFSMTTKAEASTQNQPQEMDDLIQSFIAETVPNQAKQMENTAFINANRGSETIIDKVKGNVYTFAQGENVYTVVDFYAVDKLKTSENDTFVVLADETLLPTEVIEAEYYTKKEETQPWGFTRKLNSMLGLSKLELYGSEINDSKPYMRILLCFVGEFNLNEPSAVLRYVVTYTQADIFYIPYIVIIVGAAIVVFAVWGIRQRKKKKVDHVSVE